MPGLPKVGPGQLSLDKNQAHAILKLFFQTGLTPNALQELDLCFAQAVLTHAIDKSFEMGFAEAAFNAMAGTAKIGSGPMAAIKKILSGSGKNLLKFKDKDKLAKMLESPCLYGTVVSTITRNQKTNWMARETTGEYLDFP